jgi:hypothetical protein
MTSDPAAEMQRLQALVFDDEGLCRRLGPLVDPAVFAAQAAEAAQAGGIALDAATLSQRLHSPGLRQQREQRGRAAASTAPQAGWLPTALHAEGPKAEVEWSWFGDQPLSEPFFEDSAQRARWLPFNRLFGLRTGLGALARWSQTLPTIQPTGFIFHVSRCGSTLAAQMLAASPANIVVSEAMAIDAVVRLDPAQAGSDEEHAALLRAMIGTLGQRRAPEAQRYFIKLDCWHTRALPLFRRAFPETPWVFLYREPREVMVSQMRQRGRQMVPDFVSPGFLGIRPPERGPDGDYCARVLGAICEAALEGLAGSGGLAVNYDQLPEALFTTLLPHFGVTCAADEREAMALAARRDAKAPHTTFTSDAAAKRQEITDEIALACASHLDAPYRRLEACRAADVGARHAAFAHHPFRG